jgi:hypothetical protein
MPALFARGPGVYVQTLLGIVEHDLQDMRMATDK